LHLLSSHFWLEYGWVDIGLSILLLFVSDTLHNTVSLCPENPSIWTEPHAEQFLQPRF
jgi:hypothetical protein